MTTHNLRPLVDDLGHLQAQAADIAARMNEIKSQLVSAGVDAIEGDLFRVTVSHSERETLDMEAVREKLTPQFIRAHTRVTPVTTVRCKARLTTAARVLEGVA
jgi:hypothetical protein